MTTRERKVPRYEPIEIDASKAVIGEWSDKFSESEPREQGEEEQNEVRVEGTVS